MHFQLKIYKNFIITVLFLREKKYACVSPFLSYFQYFILQFCYRNGFSLLSLLCCLRVWTPHTYSIVIPCELNRRRDPMLSFLNVARRDPAIFRMQKTWGARYQAANSCFPFISNSIERET